jgi:creatinine amidohydrolase
VLHSATSPETRDKTVAVLPIGSFEQHGPSLPLTTDTLIASELARRSAEAYALLLLAPVAFSCSHEHGAFPGTVSITATTLVHIIEDVAEDLRRSGISKLVLMNGHGGNSVLTNVVQQANSSGRKMLLYPTSYDWATARDVAGCETTNHQDMHAGEAETSILLAVAADQVRPGWDSLDHEVDDRSLLTLVGMEGFTESGVIGRPSRASAEKGEALLDALVTGLGQPLKELLS